MTDKHKEERLKNNRLKRLAKTLDKENTTLTQLQKLDTEHPGILLVFWRTHYKHLPKFCGTGGFWGMMLDREPYEEDDETEDEAVSLTLGTSMDGNEVGIDTAPQEDVDAMIAEIQRKHP